MRRVLASLALAGITVLQPGDPSSIPLGELARIRGAMWSARLDLPYGPRPGRPDNILAMAFYPYFGAADRARMRRRYHDDLGYTHAVLGPIVDVRGYHGQYPAHPNPPTQAEWDAYLDAAQELWDAHIAPIFFVHPDGWTFERTRDVFTPLLRQERAQRLLRIVVPAGWEPTRHDWSSCTWALFEQWGRQTLPNALILIHTVSDADAPAGRDARCNDNDRRANPTGNAGAWARVAPFVHGWLIQNGPYRTDPAHDPKLARNFAAQFKVDGDGAAQHSIAWHFKGPGGWARDSAWGPGVPILLYAAEQTAYESYWKNLPEAASRAWGDLAVAAGADGYLDGGTVDVPRRR